MAVDDTASPVTMEQDLELQGEERADEEDLSVEENGNQTLIRTTASPPLERIPQSTMPITRSPKRHFLAPILAVIMAFLGILYYFMYRPNKSDWAKPKTAPSPAPLGPKKA